VISLDVGGQMGTTANIDNYPGVGSVTGPQLVEQFEQQADDLDFTKMIGERITSISTMDRCKILSTASGKEIHARTVILASGAFKRKLGIPGEQELAGKGVVYCATCDGPLFKKRRVAVIGSGNSALEAAIEMSGIASKVFLVSRGTWSGDEILHDKVRATEVDVLQGYLPTTIHGKDTVEGLTVTHLESRIEQRLDVDGVFIEIGLAPNSDFTLDLLETNSRGEIRIDRNLETGVRGVFAAGDVTDGREKQVVVAAGEGARAALAAFSYLVHQI